MAKYVVIFQHVFCFDFLKGLIPVLLMLKSLFWSLGPEIRKEERCSLLYPLLAFENHFLFWIV